MACDPNVPTSYIGIVNTLCSAIDMLALRSGVNIEGTTVGEDLQTMLVNGAANNVRCPTKTGQPKVDYVSGSP